MSVYAVIFLYNLFIYIYIYLPCLCMCYSLFVSFLVWKMLSIHYIILHCKHISFSSLQDRGRYPKDFWSPSQLLFLRKQQAPMAEISASRYVHMIVSRTRIDHWGSWRVKVELDIAVLGQKKWDFMHREWNKWKKNNNRKFNGKGWGIFIHWNQSLQYHKIYTIIRFIWLYSWFMYRSSLDAAYLTSTGPEPSTGHIQTTAFHFTLPDVDITRRPDRRRSNSYWPEMVSIHSY